MFAQIITYLIITYSAPLSIVVRCVSCAILLFFCIPLQFREAAVKNGLRILRLELLAVGIIIFFTNLFSLYFLFDIVFSHITQKPLNSWLQLINAVCLFGLAVIGYLIYHQQYSDESKLIHAKVAYLEHHRKKVYTKKI